MEDPILDDAPEPPPPIRPDVDPAGRVVRTGRVEAVHGVQLPWVYFRKGCRYEFEECENEKAKRYYRVFNGNDYGVVGPARFRDHFTEV